MKILPQACAIPYRVGAEGVEYLVITSMKGNWIFPKGIVDPGESPEETALKEAHEEAGVGGRISSPAIGQYSYNKWNSECRVAVFLLRVESVAESWPEKSVRQRAWHLYEDALRLIQKRKLREILELAREAIVRQTPSTGSSAQESSAPASPSLPDE